MRIFPASEGPSLVGGETIGLMANRFPGVSRRRLAALAHLINDRSVM